MPPHQTPPNIETRRLLLRGWKPGDLAPFAAICADPDVMRFIGNGATLTTEDTALRIASYEAHWADRGYGLFAVQSKATGDLIGFAGLSWPGFLPEILPAVEIGWRFAKAHWGHGYAQRSGNGGAGVWRRDMRPDRDRQYLPTRKRGLRTHHGKARAGI